MTPRPDAQRISVALDELELSYLLISYDLFEGGQHTAEFVGSIPATSFRPSSTATNVRNMEFAVS